MDRTGAGRGGDGGRLGLVTVGPRPAWSRCSAHTCPPQRLTLVSHPAPPCRQDAAALRAALEQAQHHPGTTPTAGASRLRFWGAAGEPTPEAESPTYSSSSKSSFDKGGSRLAGFNATVEVEEEVDLDDALAALGRCTTFDCIARAHEAIRGRTRFNLPHYFLIGWQKCATTSVNNHFRRHPQYMEGTFKEPHYFTVCQYGFNDRMCRPNNTADYLQNYLRIKDAVAMRLEAATQDSSVDYAWKGEPLARELRETFPWLKIVIMMREPISRVISWTRMWTREW